MFRVELPQRYAEDPQDSAALKANRRYWWEGIGYEITQKQEEGLRQAAASVLVCSDEAMEYVVSNTKVLRKFHYGKDEAGNRIIQDLAAESWKDPSQRSYIMDRWDIGYDGVNPPKLLERNFGYLGLVESTGVVQEDYIKWLKTRPGYGDVDSFGNLGCSFGQALREVAKDRGIAPSSDIVLIMEPDSPHADKGMIETGPVLAQWIKDSGFNAIPFPSKGLPLGLQLAVLEKAGFKPANPSDVSPKFSGAVYPFSCFDEYGRSLANASSLASERLDAEHTVIEPLWTLLMGHKSMLPILHQLYPDHPNLLPAVNGRKPIPGRKSFAKHVDGLQGLGAKVLSADGAVISKRHEGEWEGKRSSRYMTQAYCDAVRNPDGSNKVLHMFTTNRRPAAIGMREGPRPYVGGADTHTRFVPVFVRPQASIDQSSYSYQLFSGSLDDPDKAVFERIVTLQPNFRAAMRREEQVTVIKPFLEP